LKLIKTEKYIHTKGGRMKIIILKPANQKGTLPGLLWIHGGGYITGMAAMVNFSRGRDIASQCGAVVLSPEYRLSGKAPYPAALEDCYEALLFMKKHTEELGIRTDQLMVGGESAGGGLSAALCLYARDKKEVNISFQMPLYPMLDCQDTESSKNNHGHIWNTRRNHYGWRKYLAGMNQKDIIPSYASAARATDYSGLPPAYTFVCDGEPFYCETLTYVEQLKKAGIKASVDVYHAKTHAFDMMCPWLKVSKQAKRELLKRFEYAKKHFYAENKKGETTMNEYEIITLPVSDGTEKEFAIMDTFVAENKQYVAVSLVKDDSIQDGIFLYRYKDAEDGDMIVETISTPEEYERIAEVYESL